MDAYAYEVAAEQAALHRAVHVPMRAFYASQPSLSASFGEYPAFWRDLARWPAFKDVYRAYTKWQDSGSPLPRADADASGAQPTSSADAAAATRTLDAAASESAFQARADDVAPAVDQVPPSGSTWASAQSVAPATEVGASDGAAGKKRRRRWEADDASAEAPAQPQAEQAHADVAPAVPAPAPAPSKRRNRWEASSQGDTATAGGAAAAFPPPSVLPSSRSRVRLGQRIMPAATTLLPPDVHIAAEVVFTLRVRVEEIAARLFLLPAEVKRVAADPARPPSPPPEYDSNGKRTNSLEQRMRGELLSRRDGLIERIMDLNPTLCGVHGPKFLRRRYIPWREYPDVNFLGLVLGPRGNTQKRLEKETNCKISVRGRGSGRDPKLPKGDTANMSDVDRRKAEEEDDDLHVAIIGERLSEVEAAARLIEDLLHPKDNDDGEWKKVQLMELAAYNGMIQEFNAPCHMCGETGHKSFECPYREANKKKVDVRCAICGETSHITADCKFKDGPPPENNDPTLDKEYLSFMADLGDESAKAALQQKDAAAGGAAVPSGKFEMPKPAAMDDDAPPGVDAPLLARPSPPPLPATGPLLGGAHRPGLPYPQPAMPQPPPMPGAVPYGMMPPQQYAQPAVMPGMPYGQNPYAAPGMPPMYGMPQQAYGYYSQMAMPGAYSNPYGYAMPPGYPAPMYPSTAQPPLPPPTAPLPPPAAPPPPLPQ